MATVADQSSQLAHRSQEAFFTAVRVWQDTLRSYPGATPSTEALPYAHATRRQGLRPRCARARRPA